MADVELLQAEIEALRTIAGCAYQMAGVHDAPEIWLDRLSEAANGDPLPDPDTISDELLPYQPEAVCDVEIRARKLEAEIEALRAEVSAVKESLSTDLRAMRAERERAMEARQLISDDLATAEARADKLEEALEDIRSRSSINLAMRSDQFALAAYLGDIHQIADAALSKENSDD